MAATPKTKWWPRVVVAALVLAIYAITYPSPFRNNPIDIEATSIPAWHFVETGTWDLSTQNATSPWFVETDRGLRSNLHFYRDSAGNEVDLICSFADRQIGIEPGRKCSALMGVLALEPMSVHGALF